MPYRKTPLVTDETYHVFNRGIDRRTTFTDVREFTRVMKTANYYRFVSPPCKLSRFLMMEETVKKPMYERLMQSKTLVDILSFCYMPNHFHFLIRQKVDNGISHFVSQLQNSYTRYFNVKHERVGPLFLDQFKAVRIETEEQLVHVSRYIHLNPYTSFVVKDIEELFAYRWSSLPEFLTNKENSISDRAQILNLFKSVDTYKSFIQNQAEYQRELDRIKHLIHED